MAPKARQVPKDQKSIRKNIKSIQSSLVDRDEQLSGLSTCIASTASHLTPCLIFHHVIFKMLCMGIYKQNQRFPIGTNMAAPWAILGLQVLLFPNIFIWRSIWMDQSAHREGCSFCVCLACPKIHGIFFSPSPQRRRLVHHLHSRMSRRYIIFT